MYLSSWTIYPIYIRLGTTLILKKPISELQSIVSRKGSSKMLTFSMPHVLKAIQMLSKSKYVSRASFSRELYLGEGAVKTLISHLKQAKMADSSRSGTCLTEKGVKIADFFSAIIPFECKVPRCKLAERKFNHAVILKKAARSIKTGLEQRDFAILYGSQGCTTLIFKNNRFIFPGDEKDALHGDAKTKNILFENLFPEEDDVIIISSSDDRFVSEISAKNSAIGTLASLT